MLYDFLKKENGVSDAVCTNRTAHEVPTWKQLPKQIGGKCVHEHCNSRFI